MFETIFDNWKIFKNDEKCFLFQKKFFSWLFGHVSKVLDQKDKVNFKFFDVTAWLTNYCNAHIAQYLEE